MTKDDSIFEGTVDGIRVVYGMYKGKHVSAIVHNDNVEAATAKIKRRLAKLVLNDLTEQERDEE